MKAYRQIARFFFAIALVFLTAEVSIAQSPACVSLSVQVDGTAMTAPRTVREGDDYATNLLNDPWDFSDGRDFGFEANFLIPTTTGGVWSATNDASGKAGKVFPLFAGVAGTNLFQPLPGDASLPKFGSNLANQIISSRYDYLSFRFRHQALNSFRLEWKVNDLSTNAPTSESYVVYETIPSSGASYRSPGWNIYGIDFVDLELPWEELIEELAFVPSIGGGVAGKKADFDWIRLVDPESAPELTFTASIFNSFSNCAFIGSSIGTYTIYADSDGVKGNAEDTPVAKAAVTYVSGSAEPLTVTFPSAALPPGDYTFYADVRDGTGAPILGGINNDTSVVSASSSKLTIVPRPQIVVTAPAPNSTVSYDDAVVGNAWEMDAASDVSNLDGSLYQATERNFKGEQFLTSSTATFFKAQTSNPVVRPRALSAIDNGFQAKVGAQLHLPTSPFDPIIPADYRYLVFRMRGDQTSNSNRYLRSDNKLQHNWFAQAAFWNTKNEFNLGWSKEQFLYEGWNTYVIDLWDFEEGDGKPWLANSRISNLRLQPMNSSDANVGFDVDFVKLYKENLVAASTYQIKYKIVDPGAPATRTYRVKFFYDTINAIFDASSPIATQTVTGQGEKTYNWSVPADLSGEYYVYVQIVDTSGNELSGMYSTAPVVIGGRTASFAPSAMDYDGDGKSDNGVYRPTTGHSFQRRSASQSVYVPWVVGDQYHPLAGDFDGDGITDLGFVFEYAGWLGWYIFKSDTSLPLSERLYFRVWGKPGDSIVVGDYLGADKEQIAVYRDGDWYVLDENDGAYVFSWGVPGDVPVPGDFDGDFVLDLAIWRPTTGEWWVAETATGAVQVQQWGLDGDIPLVADWSGDGVSDFGIYRPNGSLWGVLENSDHDDDGLNDGLNEIVQWGLAGDIPVVGDFNGDGHADLTVYRPETGMWFHNFRNKKQAAVQYGLPGDRIPGVIKATVAK